MAASLATKPTTSVEVVSQLPKPAGAKTGAIVWAILATPWKVGKGSVVTAGDIGRRFLTDFAPPFEAVALLLLAALIGAVVLFKGGKAQS